MENWKERLKAHRDLWVYLLCGGLTTLINFAVYLGVYNSLRWCAAVSNAAAWAASVIFAFFTNKALVYCSRDWSGSVVMGEAARFMGCRAASGIAETGLLFLCADVVGINGNLVKLLTAVFVVAMNYLTGRDLVFHRKQEP